MTEHIKEYEKVLIERLSKKASAKQFDEWISFHKIQIKHLKHERLIHLLVTLTFGICFLLSVLAFLISEKIGIFGISCLFLILLTPYIFHYYFLENTTQRWYGYENKLYDKKLTSKKT